MSEIIEPCIEGKFEIYGQLLNCHKELFHKRLPYNAREEVWRQVDFLLDMLIDIDAIGCLEEADGEA